MRHVGGNHVKVSACFLSFKSRIYETEPLSNSRAALYAFLLIALCIAVLFDIFHFL